MKKLYFHNIYGLGDSVFNLILFNIINTFIVKNNIKIFYYTKDEYIKQLQEFIINDNIILLTLDNKPDYSIELWIENGYFNYKCSDVLRYVRDKLNKKHINFNIFYKDFFHAVLKKLGFNITINKFLYYDDNLLDRYNLMPDKYKHFDILILNSSPNSGQYDYNKKQWDNYIINLNKRFNILTTTKVDSILCTSDDNLTIKDIASLSTKAKVVIAINSGVVPGLLNFYTLTNVKHVYIFDNRCCYSYPNFENKQNINDISFEELESYIN